MTLKKLLLFFALHTVCLTGCNMISSNNNSCFSYSSYSGIMEGEVIFMSEEEQLKSSDLVCQVLVVQKGEVELIDDWPFTIYYFVILEVIKGEEKIDCAYFRGDTTEHSNVTSSIDEILIENEKYKLYLKKKYDKYITTCGNQSIIKQ